MGCLFYWRTGRTVVGKVRRASEKHLFDSLLQSVAQGRFCYMEEPPRFKIPKTLCGVSSVHLGVPCGEGFWLAVLKPEDLTTQFTEFHGGTSQRESLKDSKSVSSSMVGLFQFRSKNQRAIFFSYITGRAPRGGRRPPSRNWRTSIFNSSRVRLSVLRCIPS